jgi:hypothetical protein
MASASPGAAPSVTDGSWFWAGQPDPLPQAGYQPLPHPDVPAGEFAVGSRNGSSDKETYLHIDTSDWTTGTTVTRMVLKVKEDSAAGNANAMMADGKIQARAVVDYFGGGTEGAPYSQKPSTVKSDAADGKRGDDGTWTFDITAIASKWASGTLTNSGIGLVPNATTSDNYQVVWQGASTMTVEADVSGPTSSSGSQSGSEFPVFGSGSTSNTTPTAATPTGGGDITQPVSGDTTPTTSAPATTTTSSAKSVAEPRTHRTTAHSHHGLPAVFILVVLFILALVAAGAVALGELGEPIETRRGSVLRRLERSYE